MTSSDGPRTLEIDGRVWDAQDVVDRLAPHMTDRRRRRISDVVDHRTRSIVPVVEGLYDLGNVSAVLRSAEALGYYRAHVIETSEHFQHSSRTSAGAEKWIDLDRWSAPEPCYERLKAEGYGIAVTHLEASVPIEEVDFTQRTAVVFGNEADGVSETTLEHADVRFRLPIVGFVESYNVSVAAALTLYHVYRERQRRSGQHGDLSSAERTRLTARYYLRSVTKARQILRRHGSQ